MAKKTNDNKEMKVKAPTKKEAVHSHVTIPDTKYVDVIMNGVEYRVGNEIANILVNVNHRAKLA